MAGPLPAYVGWDGPEKTAYHRFSQLRNGQISRMKFMSDRVSIFRIAWLICFVSLHCHWAFGENPLIRHFQCWSGWSSELIFWCLSLVHRLTLAKISCTTMDILPQVVQSGQPWTLEKSASVWETVNEIQGDTSGCSPGFVDIKTKVAF